MGIIHFAAMPGMVSVKTPANTTPLHISLRQNDDQILINDSISQSTFLKRIPSPSSTNPQTKPYTRTPEKLPSDESSLDNLDLGRFLLKLAGESIASGDNPNKALDYATRASISFERCSGPGPGPELATSLHMVAAIYCNSGRFEEAVPILQRSIEVLDFMNGSDHAMAKFSGYMLLGDTYSVLGQLDRSISCYDSGLKIQMEALGDLDPRVAETCRLAFSVCLMSQPYLRFIGQGMLTCAAINAPQLIGGVR